MNCESRQELLTPYLLGDLPDAAAAEMRQHLAHCPACRAAAGELELALDLLRSGLAAVPAGTPVQLDDEHRQAVLSVPGKRLSKWELVAFRQVLPLAASLVLVGGILFIWLKSGGLDDGALMKTSPCPVAVPEATSGRATEQPTPVLPGGAAGRASDFAPQATREAGPSRVLDAGAPPSASAPAPAPEPAPESATEPAADADKDMSKVIVARLEIADLKQERTENQKKADGFGAQSGARPAGVPLRRGTSDQLRKQAESMSNADGALWHKTATDAPAKAQPGLAVGATRGETENLTFVAEDTVALSDALVAGVTKAPAPPPLAVKPVAPAELKESEEAKHRARLAEERQMQIAGESKIEGMGLDDKEKDNAIALPATTPPATSLPRPPLTAPTDVRAAAAAAVAEPPRIIASRHDAESVREKREFNNVEQKKLKGSTALSPGWVGVQERPVAQLRPVAGAAAAVASLQTTLANGNKDAARPALHTETLLNGLDYGLKVPAEANVALVAEAGPSPFAPGQYLLFVALKTPDRLEGTLTGVGVEVSFAAAGVARYRSVGGGMTSAEPSAERAVAGTELKAGEYWVGLYEWVPNATRGNLVATVSVRGHGPGQGETLTLERQVVLRDLPTTMDGCSPAFRLAAGTAIFAEIQQGKTGGKAFSYADVQRLLQAGGAGSDAAPGKRTVLSLVEAASGSAH